VPQAFQLRSADASANPAGVSEPPVGVVIGEQQISQPGTGAFGIGPADHHELLAVEAFDLEPQTAISRCIGRIGLLRDDPFQLQAAGTLIEIAAAPGLIVAVLKRRTRLR
jgi:hypothetical protein